MAATAETVIQTALSYVGVKEDPDGSNITPFTLEYFDGKLPANPAASAPWCVIFGWYCFKHSNASDIFYDGKKVGSCTYVLRWATNNKLTVNKDQAKRGDILLFDWNKDQAPDHFGFALDKPANGKISTVEGNTNNQVATCTRNMTDVGFVIRPKYLEAPSPSNTVTWDDLKHLLQTLLDSIS